MKTPKPKLPVTAVELKLEIPIAAAPEKVWDALVNETSEWWPASFHTMEGTRGFVIEPKVGGRVYEDAGHGEGTQWYVVAGVQRPNFLLLSGFVAPPFGGPAVCYLRLTLARKGKGETTLEISDSAVGHLANYDVEAGWRLVFGDGLARHVETKVRKR